MTIKAKLSVCNARIALCYNRICERLMTAV